MLIGMWQSTKPTEQDIEKATSVAQRIAINQGTTMTVAKCFRLSGPAFSRVQYDVCLLEGAVKEPKLLPELVMAFPIHIVAAVSGAT